MKQVQRERGEESAQAVINKQDGDGSAQAQLGKHTLCHFAVLFSEHLRASSEHLETALQLEASLSPDLPPRVATPRA